MEGGLLREERLVTNSTNLWWQIGTSGVIRYKTIDGSIHRLFELVGDGAISSGLIRRPAEMLPEVNFGEWDPASPWEKTEHLWRTFAANRRMEYTKHYQEKIGTIHCNAGPRLVFLGHVHPYRMEKDTTVAQLVVG